MPSPVLRTSTTRHLSRSVALAFVLIACSVSVFAARRERLIDTWKPTHYSVAITLDQQLTEITTARTEIEVVAVKSLSTIDLDFGEMTIDSVLVDGNPATFEHRNRKLDIKLLTTVTAGTKLIVTVTYHGKPKDGLAFAPDKDNRPTVVGDNWPNRLHHWIPSLDHPAAKATVNFTVTAPDKNVVVANGRFIKAESAGTGMKTWTFNEGSPIPPYCMIVGVGQFSHGEIASSITPLSFYVPHSDLEYAPKGFAPANPALEMFTQQVGPYPYDKLALIVGATRFGGMENSNAIVFASTLFNQDNAAKLSVPFGIPLGVEGVIAHEIAHQWFGDSVTESTWADLWLSEGFATYFAGLFILKHDGDEAFRRYMEDAAKKVFEFERKSRLPIHDRDTEDLFKLLNANNYQKGAWVLHMLRSQLGDDVFFRAVRLYYEKHKHSVASTEDLRNAFEQTSKRSLQTFFDRWIYQSGHPKYEVNWKWLRKERKVRITLKQVQEGNAFVDPLPVAIRTAGGTVHTTITPNGKTVTHILRVTSKPTKVEVDPMNTLLREVIN